MAQIIELHPDKQHEQAALLVAINNLTQAAWQFAYAALWQEQKFPEKEIERVQQQIKELFNGSTNLKKTLKNICERVILANRLLATERSRFLPNPSVWFNKNFSHGYTATEIPFMEMTKLNQPHYAGISTLATCYVQYLGIPTSTTFSTCRNKLLALKEYGLLQLFYNSIIYYQFSNKAI